MNDSSPSRRWFQLSLTTCILMMVVAGVLVWGNVKSSFRIGWPLICYRKMLFNPVGGPHLNTYHFWNSDRLILDVVVALAILAATATLSETLIRRRGRTKQEVEA